MIGMTPMSRNRGRMKSKMPGFARVLERPAKVIKKNIAAKMPRGRNVTREDLALSEASARSRFQPQRGQKGLLVRLKARRKEMEEPQRGQVMEGMDLF